MGFGQLLWGFVFLFDFRINGFDILPDAIGYLLIYMGLNWHKEPSSPFHKAQMLIIPLLFLSIFDMFPGGLLNGAGGWSTLLRLAYRILDLMAVYQICLGIQRLAEARGDFALAQMARTRWNMYFIVGLLALFPVIFLWSAFLAGPLAILFFLFGLITYLLMLNLMWECGGRIY
jgi:hypothetical protein